MFRGYVRLVMIFLSFVSLGPSQGSHSYASVKFHDFSMTFNAFFHDYFTRLKCKIYEKCCNNHHTRPYEIEAFNIETNEIVLAWTFLSEQTSKSWNVIKNIYCKI